jgi:hypothetical protein
MEVHSKKIEDHLLSSRTEFLDMSNRPFPFVKTPMMFKVEDVPGIAQTNLPK